MAEWIDMLEENLRKAEWILVIPEQSGYRAIPYRSFENAFGKLREYCEAGLYACLIKKGGSCHGTAEVFPSTPCADR